jgi:hypothetical protein
MGSQQIHKNRSQWLSRVGRAALFLMLIVLTLESSSGAGGRRGTPLSALLRVAETSAQTLTATSAHIAPGRAATTLASGRSILLPYTPSHRGPGVGHHAGAAVPMDPVGEGITSAGEIIPTDGTPDPIAAPGSRRAYHDPEIALVAQDRATSQFPTRAPPLPALV